MLIKRVVVNLISFSNKKASINYFNAKSRFHSIIQYFESDWLSSKSGSKVDPSKVSPAVIDSLGKLDGHKNATIEYLRSIGIEDPNRWYNHFLNRCWEYETSKLPLHRLRELVVGEAHYCGSLTFTKEFKIFCEKVPQWKPCYDALINYKNPVNVSQYHNDGCVAFWLPLMGSDRCKEANFNINFLLPLRSQQFKYCYLDAPITLEHYLVSIATKCNDIRTVNTGLWLAKETAKKWKTQCSKQTEADLRKWLKDGCGDCLLGLIALCGLTPEEYKRIPKKNPQQLYELVQKKPLLVRRFMIFDEFNIPNKVSYSSSDISRQCMSDLIHSMLIIGARKTKEESAGGYYFLLQNWWSTKPFVEVSATYFESVADVNPVYVTKELSESHRIGLNTFEAEYIESSLTLEEEVDQEGGKVFKNCFALRNCTKEF